MDCAGFSRFLLITFNVIFWLLGATLILVGVSSQYNTSFASENLQTIGEQLGSENLSVDASQISWILIIIGSVTFVLGGVGCCGAFNKSRTLLTLYIIMLLILISVKLLAIYMFISFQSSVTNEFQNLFNSTLTKSISSNFTDQIATQAVDSVQLLFNCCGSNSSLDYIPSGKIPISCYPNSNTANNVSPYSVGCISQISSYIGSSLQYLVYSLFSIMIIEILAVAFSVCIYQKNNEKN